MGIDGTALIRPIAAIVATTALAAPAAAQAPVAVSLPAGTLGNAVLALGRQARVTITVPDEALWRRRVPSISGRMTAHEAAERLARAAGATLEPIGAGSWRIVSRRPLQSVRRAHRPAVATAPAPTADEATEIVVTASKRDVPLNGFAGQATSIAGPELTLGGVGGTDRLVSRMASISSTYLGAGRNKLFIRGIADSSFTGPTQSTVGQYLGDVRLSYNAPDPDLRLSDLRAAEVLEGPQGTLYGAGSLGGIIRLVPNPPVLGEASASLTLGSAATWHGRPSGDAGAVINLPVGERAALRIVADTASDGGYIDKPLLERRDVNRTDVTGGRATLRIELGGPWHVDITALGQHIFGRDSQYADRAGIRLSRSALTDEGFEADYHHGQVALNGALGNVRITSSTGIASQDLLERYDATISGDTPRLFVQRNQTNLLTHETRLWQPMVDGSGWLAGVSYTRNRTYLSRALGAAATPGVENSVHEISAFGEGSVGIVPGLIASGGLRYTRSRLGGMATDIDVVPMLAAQRAMVTANRTEHALLPSVGMIATLFGRAQLYARYQEGFRPGGLAIESDFVRRFESDRASSMELGLRERSARRELSLSLSHTYWRDVQADFIDSNGLPSTANIGDSRIWSLSAAGAIEILAGLRASVAATLNKSEVIDPIGLLPAAPGTFDADAANTSVASSDLARLVAARMNQVPNIAEFSGRLGLDYRRALSGGGEVAASGWVRYVGPSRLGVGPELGQRQGDFLDSAVSLRWTARPFAWTIGVTNIFDIAGNRFALGTPFSTGRDQVTPLRPRTVRVGLEIGF